MTADARLNQLQDWVRDGLGEAGLRLRPLAGDASFRRYFRTQGAERSWVAMDAPPEQESVRAYLDATACLQQAGVHVPAVRMQDEARGFLLLEDLGDAQYLSRLDAASADGLYADAIQALLRIQALPRPALPVYDAALLRTELDLFADWYLDRHLGWQPDGEARALIEDVWQRLIAQALEQPQVVVHRDYHSRNLMAAEPNPGILDHQDAVWGPVSYDLASLLRDCYIAWPEARVRGWTEQYRTLAQQHGILDRTVDAGQFRQWFDWMGLQRHLKAIGIFARLCHRDGKPDYLRDVPRIFRNVRVVCAAYPELQAFGALAARLPGP